MIVAASRERLRAFYREFRLLEGAAGFDSALFKIARDIVRLTAEDAKPNAQRLREYSDASRSSLELALYSPAPIYDEFETARLASSLAFLSEQLGPNHPAVQAALKEVASLLNSPASYVVCVVFLVISGWLFTMPLFSLNQSTLDTFLRPLPLLFTPA